MIDVAIPADRKVTQKQKGNYKQEFIHRDTTNVENE